jgi:hypothetical protein
MPKAKPKTKPKAREWNGAGAPAGRKSDGRKRRSVLDSIDGLQDWLKDRLAKDMTLDGMLAELPATGFWRKLQEVGYKNGIPRSTLSDYIANLTARQMEKQILLELAELYNQTGEDGGVLRMETMIVGIANAQILKEFLTSARNGAPLDGDRLEQFRKLAVASAALQKAKHWIDHGREEMLAIVQAELVEQFKGDAAATRLVLRALEKVRTKEAA